MAVRKIDGRWWVDLRHNFERYRKKSPGLTRGDAQQYEVFLRRELTKHGGLDHLDTRRRPEALTFAAFAERWMRDYVAVNNKPSEQRAKHYTLAAHLLPVFGRRRLDAIGTADVEAFKGRQRERGLSAKTVNNHLATLRKCLATAQEWSLLTHLPRIKPLRCTLPPVHFLAPADFERLLAASPAGLWRTMVLTALRTGLRIGELIALEWSDIDPENGVLTVQRSWVRGHVDTPKTYRIRHVPLTPDLQAALAQLPRTDDRVFDLNVRDPYQYALRRIGWFYAAAGLDRRAWHTLRHTFATELTRADVHLLATMTLLGHTSTKMTERYAHVAPNTLRDAIRRLPPIRTAWAAGGQPGPAASSSPRVEPSQRAPILLSI